jgi:hypothetical protein
MHVCLSVDSQIGMSELAHAGPVMFALSVDICALGRFARYELQFPPRNRMMTDPTSAIKREVHQLVDLQIQSLQLPSSLTTSDLLDYRVRSEQITVLYQELDRIRRASFKAQLRRAS